MIAVSGTRHAVSGIAHRHMSTQLRRMVSNPTPRSRGRFFLASGLVISGTFLGLSQANCLPSREGSAGADGSGSSLSSGWLYGVAAGVTAAGACLLYLRNEEVETEKRLKRWHNSWEVNNPNRAGFHRTELHDSIDKFLPRLLDDGISAMHFPKRVLVTLCGKAVDMPYLASLGHKVVGCDGIRQAALEFIDEQGATVTATTKTGGFEVLDLQLPKHLSNVGMRYVIGDFFRMKPSTAGRFECCYDRGALVAIDPALRPQYVETLTGLLDKGARILLVATEHDPMVSKPTGQLGPPFDLTEREIRGLFAKDYTVQLLQRESLYEKEPWWKARGATYFNEAIYVITKRT